MQTIEEALKKLNKSKFRSSFHLGEKEYRYVKEKGFDTVRVHAADFVRERLSAEYPQNDGKQTPMRGHPVFIAQHATATCCRGCLYKWYKVKKGTALDAQKQEKIVNLIMAWVEKEVERRDNDK